MPKNPLLTDGVLRSMPGSVWHDRRIMPPALLTTTSFWTAGCSPKASSPGPASSSAGMAANSLISRSTTGPEAPRPAFRRDDLRAQLAPHLSRAWRLGRTARAILQHGATRFSVAPSEPRCAASPAVDIAGEPGVIRLRAEFCLTKAEARLAFSPTAHHSRAWPKAFDVKLTTIRSQLQQVFAKTGTSRQAELVALLLSHGYVSEDPVEPAQEPAGQRSSYTIPALQRTT